MIRSNEAEEEGSKTVASIRGTATAKNNSGKMAKFLLRVIQLAKYSQNRCQPPLRDYRENSGTKNRWRAINHRWSLQFPREIPETRTQRGGHWPSIFRWPPNVSWPSYAADNEEKTNSRRAECKLFRRCLRIQQKFNRGDILLFSNAASNASLTLRARKVFPKDISSYVERDSSEFHNFLRIKSSGYCEWPLECKRLNKPEHPHV